MIIEATQRFVAPGSKPLAFLQKHPEVIAQLIHYPAVVTSLSKLPLTMLPVDWEAIAASVSISREQKLLTNDAIIVAVMQHHQLRHLITNDDDFDSVPGLTVRKPR